MMNKKIEQPFNLAIRYLSYKPRTIFEMQSYLKKKGVDDAVAEKIITLLLDKKYLDDDHYAESFIEIRARHNPKSKFALKYELKNKGVAEVIIDKNLQPYDDKNLAIKAIAPKFKLWENFDDEKFKRKIMNYLKYRGFSYEIWLSTLNHFRRLKRSTNEECDEN